MTACFNEIDATIRRFSRRRCRLRAINAIGVGLALACFWLLLGVTLDRCFRLPVGARAVVLGGLLLISVVTLLRAGRWIFHRADQIHAAAMIEQRLPAVRDRLLTVVTQRALPSSTRASDALLSALEDEVARIFRESPPPRTLTLLSIRPAGMLLSGALAMTLALAALIGSGFPRLIARQLVPWAGILPVTLTSIDVLGGSRGVLPGQTLAVVADLTPDPGSATLLAGANIADAQPLEMTHTFGGRYTATLPRLHRTMVYRVRGGDAESPWYVIHMVTPPVVKRLDLVLEPPGGTAQKIDAGDGTFAAIRGTRVAVRLTANQPLSNATLTLGRLNVLTEATDDPAARTAEFFVTHSGRWSIMLVSAKGVAGTGPHDMRITALPVEAAPSKHIPINVPPGYEPALNNYLRAIATTQPGR